MEKKVQHRINALIAPSRYALAREYIGTKNITLSRLTGCLLEMMADAAASGDTADAEKLIKKIGAEK